MKSKENKNLNNLDNQKIDTDKVQGGRRATFKVALDESILRAPRNKDIVRGNDTPVGGIKKEDVSFNRGKSSL